MARSIQYVMVVRTDWSVGLTAAEPSATPGLVVIADCRACRGANDRHRHRRWCVQTAFGYRVGDQWLPRRRDALAAAAALGALPIDWANPALAVDLEPSLRRQAMTTAWRWGLGRAA